MAGILKVDDLRGNTSAGNITITSEGGSATMQLQQGVAKAWVNFNGTGTIASNDSFNESSLTDSGTGSYQVNLTNDMANANYTSVGSGNDNVALITTYSGTYSASSVRVDSRNSTTGGASDWSRIGVNVHGDLA